MTLANMSTALWVIRSPRRFRVAGRFADITRSGFSPNFRVENRSGRDSVVKIFILSFSYKRGLPEDKTGNGGGFVFDCRAMPNPFWDEPLRGFSGCDKPIAEFFERHKDKASRFLDAAETLIRQSIVQYQKDGREHLQAAFGCTGGQHRSVYFAERMAERLADIADVEIVVEHAARGYWKSFTEEITFPG